MQAEQKEQLTEVFTRVAERITFMFAEPADRESLEPPTSDFRCIHIAFHGDYAGDLTMWIPTDARAEITENVLGEDVEDDGSDDTLGELMNMVCGNFLTQIVGYDGVLNLTPPRCEAATESFESLVQDPDCIPLLLEEHPVFLKANLKNCGDKGSEAA